MKALVAWLDDRLGLSSSRSSRIIEHPVPPTRLGLHHSAAPRWSRSSSRWSPAWRWPSATCRRPTSAYESLQFITDGAVLGSIVRGIHFWGASAMVLLVCVHCGAGLPDRRSFKFPREVNWLSGDAAAGLHASAWRSPASCCAGTRTRTGRSWSARPRPARAPFIGDWLTRHAVRRADASAARR